MFQNVQRTNCPLIRGHFGTIICAVWKLGQPLTLQKDLKNKKYICECICMKLYILNRDSRKYLMESSGTLCQNDWLLQFNINNVSEWTKKIDMNVMLANFPFCNFRDEQTLLKIRKLFSFQQHICLFVSIFKIWLSTTGEGVRHYQNSLERRWKIIGKCWNWSGRQSNSWKDRWWWEFGRRVGDVRSSEE